MCAEMRCLLFFFQNTKGIFFFAYFYGSAFVEITEVLLISISKLDLIAAAYTQG